VADRRIDRDPREECVQVVNLADRNDIRLTPKITIIEDLGCVDWSRRCTASAKRVSDTLVKSVHRCYHLIHFMARRSRRLCIRLDLLSQSDQTVGDSLGSAKVAEEAHMLGLNLPEVIDETMPRLVPNQ
jgi:hypothetical protein